MGMLKYIGALVIIVLLVAAAYVVLNNGTTSNSTSTLPSSASSTSYTSLATSSVTTTVTPNVTQSGQLQCTPSSGYTCSNVSYSFAKSGNVSAIYATISEHTGLNWSGYGLGFAPVGTKINNGVPEIMFIVSSNATKTNVGQNLQNGQVVRVQLYNGINSTGITKINGTVWACFVNSGILYVGNGCTSSSSTPAQYVQIGTIH